MTVKEYIQHLNSFINLNPMMADARVGIKEGDIFYQDWEMQIAQGVSGPPLLMLSASRGGSTNPLHLKQLKLQS